MKVFILLIHQVSYIQELQVYNVIFMFQIYHPICYDDVREVSIKSFSLLLCSFWENIFIFHLKR